MHWSKGKKLNGKLNLKWNWCGMKSIKQNVLLLDRYHKHEKGSKRESTTRQGKRRKNNTPTTRKNFNCIRKTSIKKVHKSVCFKAKNKEKK